MRHAPAQTVAHWRDRIASITALIAETTRQIAETAPERDSLADQLAHGDMKASAKLDELRRERLTLEGRIGDLQVALGRAQGELRAAEADHHQVVKAAAVERGRALVADRIEVARRFDVALAEATAAHAEWEALGRQLLSVDLPIWVGMGSVTLMESMTGTKRPASAAAPLAGRLLPASNAGSLGSGTTLADSERGLWHALNR